MLKPGDKLPDFTLNDQHGNPFHLAERLGTKHLVIYFYPKNETPGCTKEACLFRDHYEEFTEKGCEVIGISSDKENSHRSFAENHRLPFVLLSDPGGKVRKKFGATGSLFGLIPGRITYVADRKGIVRHVFDSLLRPERHIREALTALEKTGE